MKFSAKLVDQIKILKVPLITTYPIVVILVIPLLLIVNTYWNLRSFGRDANFILRHQAISIANTLRIHFEHEAGNANFSEDLHKLVATNEDLISISIFKKNGDAFQPYATTLNREDVTNLSNFPLNQFALGFNEPFAALTYNPNLSRNIWNVIVPIQIEPEYYLLSFQLDSKNVNEILQRTSKDSLIILFLLLIFTFVLLANHFYFYIRALKTRQLEELERLKDEFISMAAHELRAPITGITGYLELLKDKIKRGESKSIDSDIGILTTLTKDLNGLVEELLDVSRIEQGRIRIEVADTNIGEIIDKVALIMIPMASQNNLKLNVIKTELPVIKTDSEKVRQVITNLISNSIKYSLKGEITVLTSVVGKQLKITVKDTGIGIPPEEMKKLFGKFHRVKDTQTFEVRGTGLGLWITKQIVELLGGTINVESVYGSGSSFSFTLPIN